MAALRGDHLCRHWEEDNGESGVTFGKWRDYPSVAAALQRESPELFAAAVELKITVSHGQQLVSKTQSKLGS